MSHLLHGKGLAHGHDEKGDLAWSLVHLREILLTVAIVRWQHCDGGLRKTQGICLLGILWYVICSFGTRKRTGKRALSATPPYSPSCTERQVSLIIVPPLSGLCRATALLKLGAPSPFDFASVRRNRSHRGGSREDELTFNPIPTPYTAQTNCMCSRPSGLTAFTR